MSTYKDYLNTIWYDPKSPIALAVLKALKCFVIKDNKYRIGVHEIAVPLIINSMNFYFLSRDFSNHFSPYTVGWLIL
jgi:hypothetical protein